MSPRPQARALLALLFALAAATSCAGGLYGKTYEYEEDLYVSLDGSARLIVNASIPALVALRGLDLQTDPSARLDRDKVRAAYTSPVAKVTRVSRGWRRAGRQFVQIQLAVPEVGRLHEAAPFGWSKYAMSAANGEHVFKQRVEGSAFKPGTLQKVGWTGQEIVAFRLHLPSRVKWHNSRSLETNETNPTERGNILRWEQHLADRLEGVPVDVEVRMESESILYRTLWLFGGAFLGAMAVLALCIWLMFRRGAAEAPTAQTP